MSRLPVERNPDVFEYAQTGLVLAVGYALLAPGADGQSALGHIMGAFRGGLLPTGPPAGAQTPQGKPTPGASSGNTYGPANLDPGAPDWFNINTDPSVSSWHLDQANIIGGGGLGSNPTNPTISGHIGLGHAGAGGIFTLVLWGQSLGILGIGSGPIVNLWQTDFSTGGDNNWTGYGVDFSGVAVATVSGPGQTKIWATIYSRIDNSAYTTAVIAGRGGLAAGA